MIGSEALVWYDNGTPVLGEEWVCEWNVSNVSKMIFTISWRVLSYICPMFPCLEERQVEIGFLKDKFQSEL